MSVFVHDLFILLFPFLAKEKQIFLFLLKTHSYLFSKHEKSLWRKLKKIQLKNSVLFYHTALLTDKDKIVEEMRLIMDEFFQQTIKSLKKMKAKHKKELLKYVKSAPARSEKRTSMLTNSSFINSRNNLNEDDISVIELEDLRLNSTKC